MSEDVRRSCHLILYNVYLRIAFLIIKFKVRTVSYSPRFFLFTYGPSKIEQSQHAYWLRDIIIIIIIIIIITWNNP